MNTSAIVSVLNIHWGFSFGGITQYATAIESVSKHAPIRMMSVCIIGPNKHIDQESLNRLEKVFVIERSGAIDVRWIRRLADIVMTERPDIIFTHAFNGHFAALTLKIGESAKRRYCASYHGRYHPSGFVRRLVSGVYNFFCEWYLRRIASHIITVAECGKSYLVSKGVPGDRISVIHNGISEYRGQVAGNADLRKELGVAEGGVLVGVVCRLEPVKGLDYLLHAFSHIKNEFPDARLVIIGSGVQEKALKDLVVALGIEDGVVFAGYKSGAEKYYFALDIFALPSLSEFHSIGLLEAMRAGCAIVATDVGGNTESVSDNKEALIVRPANINELAHALRRLYSSPDLRRELGNAARQRYLQEFTLDVMVRHSADFIMRSANE